MMCYYAQLPAAVLVLRIYIIYTYWIRKFLCVHIIKILPVYPPITGLYTHAHHTYTVASCPPPAALVVRP